MFGDVDLSSVVIEDDDVFHRIQRKALNLLQGKGKGKTPREIPPLFSPSPSILPSGIVRGRVDRAFEGDASSYYASARTCRGARREEATLS
ncbi:hypothetical protein NPIL_465771 [Nephila pilipes]|uniref:Uncharacterized protein n=1 Tax=Nephila pilipes TaxID=299642 RepID=A0A8X6PKP2_NEPPI|nr:hypothetical protein NPIL_465771 [Nephila pilipes]